MAVVAAGAGIHGGDDDHGAGIGKGAADPGNGHRALLNGLSEDLHSRSGEFRELVQKEDTVMSQ